MIVREATRDDAVAIARVHVDTWRVSYRGIVPDEFLAGLTYEKREREWAALLGDAESRDFTYVTYVAADATGQIVGFARGGPERSGDPTYRGELLRLYVLETYQGQELGRRLIGVVAARLRDAGIHSMLTWTMAQGPSRSFYEALGARQVRTGQWDYGGLVVDEVAYGWTDSGPLIGES